MNQAISSVGPTAAQRGYLMGLHKDLNVPYDEATINELSRDEISNLIDHMSAQRLQKRQNPATLPKKREVRPNLIVEGKGETIKKVFNPIQMGQVKNKVHEEYLSRGRCPVQHKNEFAVRCREMYDLFELADKLVKAHYSEVKK